MTITSIQTRVLTGFDDSSFGQKQCANLLRQGGTDVPFLTWGWLKEWWGVYGSGNLLLFIAQLDGVTVALAPFYEDAGTVCFVGSGYDSFCLDFVGNIEKTDVLEALLQTARDSVHDFLGFELYWLSDTGCSSSQLQKVAQRSNLEIEEIWSLSSPYIDLAEKPEDAIALTRKRSLVRHENRLRRLGTLETCHFRGQITVE